MNLDDVSQDSSNPAHPSQDCDTPYCNIGEQTLPTGKLLVVLSYWNFLLTQQGSLLDIQCRACSESWWHDAQPNLPPLMQQCHRRLHIPLGTGLVQAGCLGSPQHRRRRATKLPAKRSSRDRSGKGSGDPLYISIEADGSDLWRLDPVIKLLQEGAVGYFCHPCGLLLSTAWSCLPCRRAYVLCKGLLLGLLLNGWRVASVSL
jgi:hypothetical protein